ncbi:uncharacterized protein LOC116160057 [Photinus pyralis]|uniref:uncharacterized protein LOC116160057 n=1 Tax=Photinus pyralis TaxID=7054 RepID=UPI00126714B4|nr:uncharacterized protein LOC116160057 [Photinus pyralis]
MFTCQKCNQKYNHSNLFLNHMKIHKLEEYFCCGYPLCSKKCSNISSLRKHIKRQHCSHSTLATSDCLQPEADSIHDVTLHKAEHTESTITDSEVRNGTNNYIKNLVQSFFVKLYHDSSVTRKTIQFVAENTHCLISNILEDLQVRLLPLLSASPQHNLSQIKECLLINPLDEMLTEYNRFKSLEENGAFIRPISINIGSILDDTKKGDDVSMIYKQSHLLLIPIRKVLKQLLEIPGVLKTILDFIDKETNSLWISSIFNTQLWNKVKINFQKKIVIPLIMYFDDYECGNPLGTHAGVHKIGAVYFSIPAIPPQFASRLENHFLWGLFYSDDRNLFGNQTIFKPFVEELQYLYSNGITVVTENGSKQIHFILILILGDNLGLNSVLGLNENFSGNYFCRFCRCCKEDTQEMCSENNDFSRNANNYTLDVLNKDFGIKSYCLFNDLLYFHSTTNLCCDVMHDIFEGICRYEMAKIIFGLCKYKRYFSIIQLNRRIKYFDYNERVDIGNRIPPIMENQVNKGYLHMSSSEMYAFVIYFSILVGDLVDVEDDYWKFYLCLFDIINIIMNDIISSEEINYLAILINDHHSMYRTLFTEKLKPKHHFLTHYPRSIKSVGPLGKLSSIRFEAFHKVGKTNAHVVTSRRNIIHTLSVRYQLRLCHRLIFKIGLQNSIEVGTSVTLDSNNERYVYSQILPILLNRQFSIVKWILYNGRFYSNNIVLKLGNDAYGEPIFIEVFHVIYCSDDYILLYCQNIAIFGKNNDIKSFEIDLNNSYKKVTCIELTQISNAYPAKIHTLPGGHKAILAFKQE